MRCAEPARGDEGKNDQDQGVSRGELLAENGDDTDSHIGRAGAVASCSLIRHEAALLNWSRLPERP
jgi:hypothetical protein